jgi:RNA polymerase sigma-70 factor (ECF subfamily)
MSVEPEGSMWTSLHAALVSGERWDEFDRVYGPVIRAWAAQRGLQPADADDLAQQVFLKLTAALGSYDKERGAFRGWLYRVVANEVANHFRAKARRPDGVSPDDPAGWLEQAAVDDLASDLSGLADTRLHKLEGIKARCTPQTWALVTAFYTGQSAAEVAAAHNTTVGAVHQAVYRLKGLAKALDADGGSEPPSA